jgi:hypothetical protein
MPPKGKPEKQGGPAKVKADLSFGLKNKNRSAKVGAHVTLLQSQAASVGKNKAYVSINSWASAGTGM